MCEHIFFASDYNTSICRNCGVERPSTLTPTQGYTENLPLDLSYSRYNRMQALLNQLFFPRLYGSPNSQVVYEVLQQTFSNGYDLLKWLSALQVKNKRYQNAHYYYIIHNSGKEQKPPSNKKILSILSMFSKLEHRFECWTHDYKSFFSYNWLLGQFLKEYKLEVYLQFVKKIKCKKRVALYEIMYSFFTSSSSDGEERDVFQTNRRQLYEFLDDVRSDPQVSRIVLNQLVRNRRNNWVFEA